MPRTTQKAAPAKAEADRPRPAEPVWLVRIVIVLFLVGFTAIVARELRFLLQS